MHNCHVNRSYILYMPQSILISVLGMQYTSCTFCSCRFANSTDLFATDNFAEEVWSAHCNMLQAQNHSPSYNFYIVNAGFLDVCCD